MKVRWILVIVGLVLWHSPCLQAAGSAAIAEDYDRLGLVPPVFSISDVQRAFRERARALHPDWANSQDTEYDFVRLRKSRDRIIFDLQDKGFEEPTHMFSKFTALLTATTSSRDEEILQALLRIPAIRESYERTASLASLGSSVFHEVFLARSARIAQRLDQAPNLTNYLILVKSWEGQAESPSGDHWLFREEVSFYRKLFDMSALGSGTANFPDSLSSWRYSSKSINQNLLDILQSQIFNEPVDPLDIRIIGLGLENQEYFSLLDLLDRLLKDPSWIGRVANPSPNALVQKLRLRIILQDKNPDVLTGVSRLIERAEKLFPWCKDATLVRFLDMKLPENFQGAWRPQSSALVIMRNSLRFQTVFQAPELLDAIAESLAPGGLYLADAEAGEGVAHGIGAYQRDDFSYHSYAQLLGKPFQIGVANSDYETWVFPKEQLLLEPGEVCADALGTRSVGELVPKKR